MKIEFIQCRMLDDLARTVKPGDTLKSPDVPDSLMTAYVNNGIAIDISPQPAANASPDPVNTTQEVAPNVS